jgi:hypothetical protein
VLTTNPKPGTPVPDYLRYGFLANLAKDCGYCGNDGESQSAQLSEKSVHLA